MASQNIARLGVVLGLDTAEFTASIDKAISENAKLKNAIRRDTSAAAGELKTLIHATEDYGKALTKVQLIQRETTSGRFMNATDDMKKKLLDQAAAYDKVANVAKSAADAASKLAAQQNLIQRDSNAGLADITALKNATEDYGRTLTKVELIQREISSGKYANATSEVKNQLLQQAAAYDKVALAAKNAADSQHQLNEQQNAIRRDSNAAASEIVRLDNATKDYGKTLTTVELTQREIASGRFMNASKQQKEQLLQNAAAYDKVATSTKNAANAQFKMNEQQKIQLTYQTTDFFTQIASGQSVFLAAFQQGGQLKDVMGGIGPMFRAIGSLFTPFSVGLTTVAAAFGATAFAAYEAHKEFDKFQDSLTLTGNFAGVAADKLVNMSKSVADATKTTIGTATTVLDTLVASGKYTSTSLEAVSKAVLLYSKVAGVDGKQAAEALMSGLDGTAAGAKTLNDKMNFLTLAQYKQIEALERAGKKQEAAKLAADILSGRIDAQKRILGEYETAWDNATKAMSKFWASFKEAIAGPSTSEGMLKKVNSEIEALEFSLSKSTAPEKYKVAERQRLEFLRQQRGELEKTIALAKASEVKPGEKGGIGAYAGAGGAGKEVEIKSSIAKAIANNQYLLDVESANEAKRIELDAAKEVSEKRLDFDKKSAEEKRAFGGLLARQLDAEIYTIELKRDEKLRALRTKQMQAQFNSEASWKEANDADWAVERSRTEALERAARSQTLNMEFQQESLQLKYQLIYATEREQKLAQISLEYARRRKEIENNTPEMQQQLDRQEAIAKMNVAIEESAKRTQQVFDTVFGSLSSAIDNFVRTGKLSFKDFARSVIQDMLAMHMKLQAMTLLRGLFNSFMPTVASANPSMYALNAPSSGLGIRPRANGGPVDSGMPYLVGERGPEVIIPRSAGTVIPNNQMGMGGTTNVTNNYINAIDAKSFEDRLLGSSNAIWAANQYANKQLASNGRRA